MSSSLLPVAIGMIVGGLLIGVMISVGDILDRYGRTPYSTTNFQIIDEPEAFRDDLYGDHGLSDVATLTFDGASVEAVVFKDPGTDYRYRYQFYPEAYAAMEETEEDVDGCCDDVASLTFDHELKLTITDSDQVD